MWVITTESINLISKYHKDRLEKNTLAFLEILPHSDNCHFYGDENMNQWLGHSYIVHIEGRYIALNETKLGKLLL